MGRVKQGVTVTVVEFGIEWRRADGRWFSAVHAYRHDVTTHRVELEKAGATCVSEFMRDQRVEYTPWVRIDKEAS
jgi:hypothetical protein